MAILSLSDYRKKNNICTLKTNIAKEKTSFEFKSKKVDKKNCLLEKIKHNCRTTAVQKFRTRLGFKKYDFILIKEQPLLTKMEIPFQGKTCK